ncbi:protein translocase SEC61 complex subunit gamma [Thermogladius sp. 4427co]|uniref:protein translocase SEC61 complex subunit gamma n=1 Tax=Thermogladius sp. 4427co TaxID=3450718 RepID=UPI003F7ADD9E
MDFREMVDQWKKIFMLATKPERDEFVTTLKLSLLGLAIVGAIAFIIRIVFYAFLFPQVAG